jgi:hypothetical protein
MSRMLLFVFFIGSVSVMELRADEPDPIRKELDRARAARAEAEAKASAALIAAFEEAIKTVAGLGDLDGVKTLQAEKKAFQEAGKIPESLKIRIAAGEYQKSIKAAQAALEKTYEQAIKDATKALKIEQAEAMRTELKALKPDVAIPEKTTPLRPGAVANKDDLRKALAGTEWHWGIEYHMKLKSDGIVAQSDWEKGGLVTRWQAIDRRTVVLFIEKGRDHNRYAILTFSEDLSEYRGFDFASKDPLPPSKRKK